MKKQKEEFKKEIREKIEKLTPNEVAQTLGKSTEFVRAGLRQSVFPFGTAVQNKNGRWNYLIIKSKFLEYIGGKVNE